MKTVLKYLLFYFIFIANFDGFAQDTIILHNQKAIVYRDVVYKNINDTLDLKLDIYLPFSKTADKIPYVVQIHGGGWVFGNKEIPEKTYIEQTVFELLENEVAVISIDYRLIGKETHFPLPLEDCLDAIVWMQQHADEYQLDVNRVGVWGNSAGAQLAMLVAYSVNASAKVNYVVSHYGPTDMNNLFQTDAGKFKLFLVGLLSKKILQVREKLLKGITGLEMDKNKDEIKYLLQDLSPVSYAKTAVPTLFVHGDKDRIVALSQSKEMMKKLKENNIPYEYYEVKKGNHGFGNVDETERRKIIETTLEYIHSQNNRSSLFLFRNR